MYVMLQGIVKKLCFPGPPMWCVTSLLNIRPRPTTFNSGYRLRVLKPYLETLRLPLTANG